jgi:hypothetical protein
MPLTKYILIAKNPNTKMIARRIIFLGDRPFFVDS